MTDDEFDRILAEEKQAHDELVAALKANTDANNAAAAAFAVLRDVLVGDL